MDTVVKNLATAVYLGMGRPEKYSHTHFRRIFAQELIKIKPAVGRARFTYLFNQVDQLVRKHIRNQPAHLEATQKKAGVVRKIAPAPGKGGTQPSSKHPWIFSLELAKKRKKQQPAQTQIPLF